MSTPKNKPKGPRPAPPPPPPDPFFTLRAARQGVVIANGQAVAVTNDGTVIPITAPTQRPAGIVLSHEDAATNHTAWAAFGRATAHTQVDDQGMQLTSNTFDRLQQGVNRIVGANGPRPQNLQPMSTPAPPIPRRVRPMATRQPPTPTPAPPAPPPKGGSARARRSVEL